MDDCRMKRMRNCKISVEDINIVARSGFKVGSTRKEESKVPDRTINHRGSSFFLALGASLMFSLLRLKDMSWIADPIWMKIDEYIKRAKEKDSRLREEALFNRFENLISSLRNNSEGNSLEAFKNCLLKNEDSTAGALNFGMRCLTNAIILKPYLEPEIFGETELNTVDLILNAVSNSLQTSILLISRKSVKKFERSELRPLILLYLTKHKFSVPYDRVLYEYDQNLLLPGNGKESFPFMHMKNNPWLTESSQVPVMLIPAACDEKEKLIFALCHRINQGNYNDHHLKSYLDEVISKNPRSSSAQLLNKFKEFLNS